MAKNYIKGSFRKLNSKTAGEVIIASVLVSDIVKLANDKGYANIVISERREADQYGNTHYAYENDYDPNAKGEAKGNRAAKMNPPDFSESIAKNTVKDTPPSKPTGRQAYDAVRSEQPGDDLPF